MPIVYPYTQYSGIWTMQQVDAAIAAGTWPYQPLPAIWTWGFNNQGQLGLGNTTNYSSPKQVGSSTNWKQVSRGALFVAATDLNNNLWTWGYNSVGQLGTGNTTYYSSPVQIGALTNWSSISAGGVLVSAIKTDGTLWTWGQNNFGQLGLGNTTNFSSPKQVGGLTTWKQTSSGSNHTLALKTDGTLWSWGYNHSGQLGTNNTTYYSSPKQIGLLTTWSAVKTGQNSSFAIKTDGTLWGWGENGYGQIGNNSSYNVSSPVQIGALTSWTQNIGANASNTLAIKTDGTLWAWGRGAFGALGLGNTTDYSSPKQVGALTNWSKTLEGSQGFQLGAAIKTDGTLWTWGYNVYGEAGLGNRTYYSSPKQVGLLTTWTNVTSDSYSTAAIKIR